jgi:hypothetical protein
LLLCVCFRCLFSFTSTPFSFFIIPHPSPLQESRSYILLRGREYTTLHNTMPLICMDAVHQAPHHKVMFLLALEPERVSAMPTVCVLVSAPVTVLATATDDDTGSKFSSERKTDKTPLPPHNIVLSPVRGCCSRPGVSSTRQRRSYYTSTICPPARLQSRSPRDSKRLGIWG